MVDDSPCLLHGLPAARLAACPSSSSAAASPAASSRSTATSSRPSSTAAAASSAAAAATTGSVSASVTGGRTQLSRRAARLSPCPWKSTHADAPSPTSSALANKCLARGGSARCYCKGLLIAHWRLKTLVRLRVGQPFWGVRARGRRCGRCTARRLERHVLPAPGGSCGMFI